MRKISKKMYLGRTSWGDYTLCDMELMQTDSGHLTTKKKADRYMWLDLCRADAERFGFKVEDRNIIQVQITVQEIKNNGKRRGRSGQGRKTIKRSR